MKDKGTMRKSDTENKPADAGRRRFLNRLWAAIGLCAAVEFGWVGASMLLSRDKRGGRDKAETVIAAGNVDEFKPGTATAIPKGGFFLARLDDGGFLSLSPRCTHLGCMVTWDEREKRFACPCHGSSFNLAGEVLTGPAGRPLDYYPTRVENGVVKTDTALARRRDSFKPDQTTRI